MRITHLGVSSLRNIKRADLETDSPFVVIGGPNASGKTTCLEAIHLLLAGRSFRTREWTKLISHEENGSTATAKIGEHFVGASRHRGELPVHRLDGEDAPLSSVARLFPVQLLDTSLFDLFEGPPRFRRQLLDWGLFHVKQNFFDLWRRYQHALKQRNALLKHYPPASNEELDIWDKELVSAGELLSEARLEYTDTLVAACQNSPLLAGIDLQFSYYLGWADANLSFANALSNAREKDLKYKRSTVGPHHSDLLIRATSKKAGDTLSRGQKKLAGFGIKIEQVRMYNSMSDFQCILLCDDFSAELDTDNQKQILDQIVGLGSQVFLTAIDTSSILSMLRESAGTTAEPAKVFHVKHGEFEEVLK